MKNYILFFATLLSTFLAAQQATPAFEISDADVSRKSIQFFGGSTIEIDRKNQDPEKQNGDILLTKKTASGQILWTKFYGGSGYEYIGSFDRTNDGGLMIIGTTSSYGKGNNDLYLVKTNDEGEIIWEKTYGGFFNEYGYYFKELNNGNFAIKGKRQFCEGENVGSNCYDEPWNFIVDKGGKVLAQN
ncbi:hypothetical protein [Portibacter marinus]|uniref:hypothetical protein n=1 Tax=Portibacter marinus TaxID=2898660 RepID=UPI001F4507FC|nr:hypothetical protein [Portibacter marinus]